MLLLTRGEHDRQLIRLVEGDWRDAFNRHHKLQDKAALFLRGTDSSAFILPAGNYDRNDCGVHDGRVVKHVLRLINRSILPLDPSGLNHSLVSFMRIFQHLRSSHIDHI